MHFAQNFFDKEIRNDFEIPPIMKRCWAAQLEVLEQFDGICKRNGIRYYLGYGTLLGAVRHKGFIPWDDDIDIWMLRDDLDRFMREMKEEIKREGLELVTPFTEAEYNNLVFRLINTRKPNVDPEFLDRYWLFPYMAGLDLFPLSYVPRKKEDLETLQVLMSSANMLGVLWNNPECDECEKREVYRQLCEILRIEPVPDEWVSNQLWQITDRIGAIYTEPEADHVAALGYMFSNPRKKFRKEWFGEPVYLEFEGIQLPCPRNYHDVLRAEFGDDYMTPIKIMDIHSYPYFKSHQKVLEKAYEEHGMKCPEEFLLK